MPALLAAIEVAWWWAVSCGVWLLTLSSISAAELIVALSCGLPCGFAARATRRSLGGEWRLRPRWSLWVGPLVVAVLADSARLVATSLRSVARTGQAGQLTAVSLPPGEPEHVFAGREAVGTVALSATPGTFVVDCDPERHVLTVHSLVSGPPAMEEVVQR